MRADDFRYLGPSFIKVPVLASTVRIVKTSFRYLTIFHAGFVSGSAFFSVKDNFCYLTIFGAGSASGKLSVEDDIRYLAIFGACSDSGLVKCRRLNPVFDHLRRWFCFR
jgi:hypothetical protein